MNTVDEILLIKYFSILNKPVNYTSVYRKMLVIVTVIFSCGYQKIREINTFEEIVTFGQKRKCEKYTFRYSTGGKDFYFKIAKYFTNTNSLEALRL